MPATIQASNLRWLSVSSRRQRIFWVLFVLITAFETLFFVLIPVVLRLNLRFGVSLFDYGLRGLYPTRNYASFDLDSPDVELAVWDDRCDDGYIFMAPHGTPIEGSRPIILDARGNLIWTSPTGKPTTNFRVQEYLGEQYLTFWHGASMSGHGQGSYIMLDSSYTQRFEVRAFGHLEGDMHDFLITPNGTALIVIYDLKAANLAEFKGPKDGLIYDGVFQEVDIATGSLVFEWHFSQHVSLNATYLPGVQETGKESTAPWDPYHINSIDKDISGNYLVSARHTHSLYSIDGTTGEILWILGGKHNEFTDASDGRATNFAWQHDARWHDERTITTYDNSAKDFLGPVSKSRGMIVDLNVRNKVATVREEFFQPQGVRAHSQGNMQILAHSGNAFIGWGHCAAYSEFAPDGQVLCDTHLSPSNLFQLGLVFTYRTYKFNWIGNPLTIPSAVVEGESVYVSWNGATEVISWRLELWDGVNRENMTFIPIKTTGKSGFETVVDLPGEMPETYFRLVALDSQGGVLGETTLLSKHQKQAFIRTLGIDLIRRLSYPILVIVLMIFCCVLMAVLRIWQKLALTKFWYGYGKPSRDAGVDLAQDNTSQERLTDSIGHLKTV